MTDTKADCNIWLNHNFRTPASPKARSKSGSRAARSSKVSFTSKTQTLFTVFVPPWLKCHCSAAFEAERLACLVGGCRLPVEHGAEGDSLLDQLGVCVSALLAADPEVVLQADAHVAAEHQAHRGEVVLGWVADTGRRPGVVIS